MYSVVNINLFTLPGAMERKCRNQSRFKDNIFAASSNKTWYKNDRYLSNYINRNQSRIHYFSL